MTVPGSPHKVIEEVLEEPDATELRLHPVLHAISKRGSTEAHLVAPQHPSHEDQREAGEHHRHHVHRPLLRDDGCIKDSEAGDAL